MRTFDDYVEALTRLRREAEALPLGQYAPRDRPPAAAEAPIAAILSPHPDDEMIIGGLPLRLLREAGYRVVNFALTLGSDERRRDQRLDELRGACHYLGFELVVPRPRGIDRLTPETRRHDATYWLKNVDHVAGLLRDLRPHLLFFPHALDGHPAHMGAHLLALHALFRLREGFSCYCVETEFWAPLDQPNLLVGSSPADVADLVTALSFHEGEMRRNPFHLTLPAWMMDNARRSELVAGKGTEAPDLLYATLYRVRPWFQGKHHEWDEAGLITPVPGALPSFPPLRPTSS